jgi:hypothetical protein
MPLDPPVELPPLLALPTPAAPPLDPPVELPPLLALPTPTVPPLEVPPLDVPPLVGVQPCSHSICPLLQKQAQFAAMNAPSR